MCLIRKNLTARNARYHPPPPAHIGLAWMCWMGWMGWTGWLLIQGRWDRLQHPPRDHGGDKVVKKKRTFILIYSKQVED